MTGCDNGARCDIFLQVLNYHVVQISLLKDGTLTTRMITDAGPHASSLADVPIALLRAELERRTLGTQTQGVAPSPAQTSTRPACGSTIKSGSYNMPMHVAALFIILIFSTLGM